MGQFNKIKSKIGTMSPAAKASIALMLTNIVQKGLSLITSPIFTRLLTKVEYAQVTLFFSWYEIFLIFTGLCLSKGVFNNGMLDFQSDRERFTLSLSVLSFVSTAVIGTAVTLFSAYVWNFMDLPIELIVYMFILLAFQESMGLWSVRQRFEYKYKAITIVTLIIAVLSPICGILGIYLFDGQKILARIVGARNVFLVGYIVIVICLIKKAKGKISAAYWKYALKFNLPLIPHYLSLHILNHMDRIMIASIDSKANASVYSVAYNGAAIVKLFWQSVNASLIPWTYEKCRKEKFEDLAKLANIIVFGYGMICVCFMFLAPEIMKILAPASYHEGIYVIPSVIVGVFYSALYYLFANVVYYYKKPKYVMMGSCCSAVLNIILNALLIPVFGYLVAGYTTMAAYLLQVIIDYWAMKKVAKHRIYDMKYLIGISLLVTVTAILLNFIYEVFILRAILFVLLLCYLCFYLVKNKNTYINLLLKKGK